MKKLYSIFFFLIGIVCLVGCGQKDNPLKGKNTDERILMCLEKEYPEHDFETVESWFMIIHIILVVEMTI